VLLGPVQRQIEFGQPRCGEVNGLPALQDHLDQRRAQKGEANEEYLHEMTVFPNGKHDDQVDSTAQFLDWFKMPMPSWGAFELARALLHGSVVGGEEWTV
jgi:hypothetical protein